MIVSLVLEDLIFLFDLVVDVVEGLFFVLIGLEEIFDVLIEVFFVNGDMIVDFNFIEEILLEGIIEIVVIV